MRYVNNTQVISDERRTKRLIWFKIFTETESHFELLAKIIPLMLKK